jgi:hypothetical protein
VKDNVKQQKTISVVKNEEKAQGFVREQLSLDRGSRKGFSKFQQKSEG